MYVMCLLHDEGRKLYALCVCYVRKDKPNMCYVFVA